MGSRRPPPAPQWQVILEEIRSENRATLEAVLTLRTTFEARMDRTDEELRALGRQHGRALAEHSKTIADHSSTLAAHTRTIADHSKAIAEMDIGLRENTLELRSVSQRVDALIRIEHRVAALEKRAFGPGGGSTPAPA